MASGIKTLLYAVLFRLLACCTRGKNGTTELQCAPQLPLEHIVRVVTHPACIYEVKDVYLQFFLHCYVDTDAEMREMYGSDHVEKIFGMIYSDMEKVSVASISNNSVYSKIMRRWPADCSRYS